MTYGRASQHSVLQRDSCATPLGLKQLAGKLAWATAAAPYLVMALSCLSASTQTTITTTGGTANAVPKFSGASTVVPSVITEASPLITLGLPGIQIYQTTQTIGGSAGAGGNLTLVGGSVSGTTSGGTLQLGGPARGDSFRSKAYLAGNYGSGVSSYGLVLNSLNNMGLGLALTSEPSEKLEVNGNIKLTAGSGSSLIFADGTTQTTAWTGTSSGVNTAPNGNVGIGTTTPSSKLDVLGGFLNVQTNPNQYTLSQIDGTSSPIANLGFGSVFAGDAILRSYWGVSIDLNGGNMGDGGTSASQTRIPGTSSFTINSRTSASAFQTLFAVRNSGNVGIGTTDPGAKLEVSGNIKLSAGSGAALTFADGTIQSTAWSGSLCGGDYAESVSIAGDRKNYEPGDVLVIGTDSESDVLKSAEPYSTLVTGIYSTKPGVLGRRQTTDPSTATNEVPMAMIGIVPTKVSTENGPIKRGDLLVTSSKLGYAMKGTDRNKMLGAILGKALGNLDSGMGLIEVVVTLQ